MKAEVVALQAATEEFCAQEIGAAPSSARNGFESLHALCAIARFHQIAADPATLAHQLGLLPSEPITTADLLRAAKHLGLKAKLSSTTADRLQLTPLPALALMRGTNGEPRTV